MSHEWQRIAQEYLFKTPWLSVRKDSYKAPNAATKDMYIAERRDFVVVVSETEKGFLMVTQFRYGAESLIRNFPMGFIEEGETPESAAARELLEETGYGAQEFHLLGTFLSAPAFMKTRFHVVFARNCFQESTNIDREEEIESINSIPVSELESYVANGSVNDAATVLAYLLYKKKASFPKE